MRAQQLGKRLNQLRWEIESLGNTIFDQDRELYESLITAADYLGDYIPYKSPPSPTERRDIRP